MEQTAGDKAGAGQTTNSEDGNVSDRLCDGGICTIGYDIQGDTASPTICLEMGQTSKERDGAGQTTEVADGDVSDRLCEGGDVYKRGCSRWCQPREHSQSNHGPGVDRVRPPGTGLGQDGKLKNMMGI